MNKFAEAFVNLSNIFSKKNKEVETQYEQFFEFYEKIVSDTSSEVADAFGQLKVKVTYPGQCETQNHYIELSPTDYVWWRNKILVCGVRFADKTPVDIQLDMLNILSKKIEKQKMSADERKALTEVLKKYLID